MKLVFILLAVLAPLSLRAAEEARFISIPLDQAHGAKTLASYKEDEAWGTVPQGHQTFDRVPFEVTAKLQLAGNVDSRDGRYYVARSIGIPVGQRLARLHLLHAANIHGIDDQPVAALRVRYENGSTQTLLVSYAVHVRDFYKDMDGNAVADPNSKVAWLGPRPGRPGSLLRLYKTTFTLRTESPVEQLDAFSMFQRSSHVLVALTGELAGDATGATPTPSGDESPYRADIVLKALDRNGNPVQGARVQGVAIDDTNQAITLGRMDDSAGEPSVVPVDFPARARELRLVVSATDFVPAESVVQLGGGKESSREVLVRLDRGVRIGGIVNDPDGQPVAKAKVGIYRATHDANGQLNLFRYAESTTDRRGRWFAREAPESLADLRFQITHADYRTTAIDFSGEGTGALTREALLSAKAEFQFASNPQISGTVRDDKGEPLANVEVTFLRTNKAGKDEATRFRTDAQGGFNIAVAESGRARLVVRAPNFAPEVRWLDLDQPIPPLALSLKTGKPLKLRAVEAQTRVQPRPGLLVRNTTMSVLESSNATRGELRGEILWSAQTDANGEVMWPHPAQGTPEAPAGFQDKVLVRASAPGFHTEWTWVNPNAGEATVALHRYVPWRVRAIDAETKAPVPIFTTMNYNATNPASSYGPITAQNGEAIAGYFVDAWLKPRILTIEAPGYEKFRLTLTPELGAIDTYELKRSSGGR